MLRDVRQMRAECSSNDSFITSNVLFSSQSGAKIMIRGKGSVKEGKVSVRTKALTILDGMHSSADNSRKETKLVWVDSGITTQERAQ